MLPNEPNSQASRETKVVIALTVAGAVLRFWGLGRLGMTHFDEGIYAFVGLWSIAPNGLAALDPGVIPYAPPGYPILVGLAYSVFGVDDISALLIALLSGVATIPVVAWLARRTFGSGAGAAGAAFAAFSMAHVAFSRKALTDAPFLLAWLIALGLGMRFLERPRLGRALVFGIAVGLAQNVKYNGGITGLIIILAAVLGVVRDRAERTPMALLRTFGLGLVAALIAAAMYWPWYAFVEAHGGYAALVRHQRSYTSGVSAWWPHLRQQLAQVVALSGGMWWVFAVWAVAWLGAAFAANGPRLIAGRDSWDGRRLGVGLVVGLAVLGVLPEIGWWVGLAWFPWLWLEERPAYRVLLSWWLILSILTPFYHPYARLWLPLQALGWIVLAGTVVRLGPFRDAAGLLIEPGAGRRVRVIGTVALTATVLAVGMLHWGRHRPESLALAEFFGPTDDLRIAATDFARTSGAVKGGGKKTVRFLARRPLAFYFMTEGVPVAFLPDLAAVGPAHLHRNEIAVVDTALVDPSADPDPLRDWLHYQRCPVRLDPVTRLDVAPGDAFHTAVRKEYAIDFYEPQTNLGMTQHGTTFLIRPHGIEP